MNESKSIEIRPEVMKFAEAMERKLQENDHKSGWQHMSASGILGRIQDESSELVRSLSKTAFI